MEQPLRMIKGSRRRHGQALLMAVLIMIFVALMGATFVTVVALNLSQTARQQEKTDARQAAQAGISFLNSQLMSSSLGETWRPEQVNLPPAPGDIDYDTYYTQFDQAQGWARTVPHPASPYTPQQDRAALAAARLANPATRIFVKFPDPREVGSADAPTFLADVSLTSSGQLQLTTIGLSRRDLFAYARRVALKPSVNTGNPFTFVRFVSNYDTTNNRVITTQLAAPANAVSTTATVLDATGIETGRYLNIGGTTNEVVLVRSVTPNITNPKWSDIAFTVPGSLTGGLTANHAIDSDVRASGVWMGHQQGNNILAGETAQFDAAGSGVPSSQSYATTQDQNYEATTGQGMFANGALSTENKLTLALNSTTTPPSLLRIAGPLGVTSSLSFVKDGSGGSPSQMATPLPTPLVLQNSSSDPSAQQVKPISPMSLDAAKPGLLESTKFADVGNGSAYGYGPGLYIDNGADMEKVTTGTPGAFRNLTQGDLQRLWMRKSFPAKAGETGNISTYTADPIVSGTAAHRLAYKRLNISDNYVYPVPAPPPASGGYEPSLEERAVRGWVSPFEFRPRGVTLDLQGDTIIVTRDDRSDLLSSDPLYHKPDPGTTTRRGKGWLDTSGGLMGNVYRMKLVAGAGTTTRSFGAAGSEFATVVSPTDFNGVIFCEGNVRIRGNWGNGGVTDTIGLKVVSMGNIYIDGSLTNNYGEFNRMALMARGSVVLNPAQFSSRIEGCQDIDVSVNAVPTVVNIISGSEVQLSDVSFFRVGDRVHFSGDFNWYTISSINTATPSITLASTLAVAPTNGSSVTLLSDPGVISHNSQWCYNVAVKSNMLARDVRFDDIAGPTTYTMSLRHAGERKGMTFTYIGGAPSKAVDCKLDVIIETPPLIQDTTTPVSDREKLLTLESAPSIDLLDLPPVSTFARGDDSAQTAQYLNSQFPFPSAAMPSWNSALYGTNAGTIAARRLGQFSQATVLKDSSVDIPLTVSVGCWANPNLAQLASSTRLALLGSSFAMDNNTLAPEELPYASGGVTSTLDALTPALYQTSSLGGTQANLQWQRRSLVTMQAGRNTLVLRPDEADALVPYHIAAIGFENGDFDASTSFLPINLNIGGSAGAVTIYAQEGSWFVIPMPARSGVAAPYSDTAPLATRYRRLNYRVTVTGTITENRSPTAAEDYDTEPTPDGGTAGANALWEDSLAYPTSVDASGNGQLWETIRYVGKAPPDVNFLRLPAWPDLLYVE